MITFDIVLNLHRARITRHTKEQSTSTGLNVETLTNMNAMSISDLRRVLTSKGVSFGEDDTKITLVDLLIAQILEETYDGLASASAMRVDKAPLY